MRALGLFLPFVLMVGCGPSNSIQTGRYQQIENPNPPLCIPVGMNIKPPPGCGVTILDTQTGSIFIHTGVDWLEEDPHTGKVAIHDIDYSK
jgi:hypothetical protein